MASKHSQKQTVVWERLSDGILLVGLGISLLFFGGRHPWGYAALMLSGLLAAGLIVVDRIIRQQGRIRRTSAGWLILGGASIPLIQIIPLPQAWLSFLSPQLEHILPAWSHGTTASLLGGWHYLSVAPEETRVALSLWLAYSLIFFYTVQRIENIDDVEKVLRWFVPIVIGISIVGLLQYLFSNNKFLWLYAHPFAKTSDAVKASFTNRNHFASLVALSAGPLLWWYLANRRSGKTRRNTGVESVNDRACASDNGLRYLKWLTLPVVLLALLLTQSRGGTLAAVVALLIGGVTLFRTGWLKTRWIGAFVLGLAFLVAAILIVGTDTIARRWEGVMQLSWEQLDRGDARRTVWRNTWRAAQDFLATGSGCGSFPAVHPLYQTARSSPLYYTHAENGYLQVLLETGLPGGILLALACGALVIWTWRAWHFAPTTRHRTATGIVAAGLAAFAFHGLVDYVWYVPSLAAMVAILFGCLARLHQLAPSAIRKDDVVSRVQCAAQPSGSLVPWAIPVLGLLLCGLWEIPAVQRAVSSGVGEFSWHRYLSLYQTADWSDTQRPATQTAVDENLSQTTADPAVQTEDSLAGADSLSEAMPLPQEDCETFSVLVDKEQEMITLLATVIKHDPGRAEPHLRLAKACLRLFHLVQEQSPNPMPLSQIRDAVMTSGFSSQEELNQWLQVAIGEHIKLLQWARQEALSAVRLCPLLGEAYFILGQLSFLDGGREEDVIAWFRQSLVVRPCDGELLFRVGAECALMGSQDEAMRLWRQAFQCGRFYQYRLIERLMGHVPPDQIGQEITFLIETFEPDLEILRYMYRQYRKRYTPELLEPLRRAYTVALTGQLRDDNSAPSKRAELWLELHFLYLDGEDREQALQCAEQAVRCDPLDYRAHHYLSLRLEEMGRFAEAEEHVRWCLQRRPGHRSLQTRLHNLYQKKMKMEDEKRDWRMAELAPMGNPAPNR